MVEAPGTAPGSVTLISNDVYRHSRLPDIGYISALAHEMKGKSHRWAVRSWRRWTVGPWNCGHEEWRTLKCPAGFPCP